MKRLLIALSLVLFAGHSSGYTTISDAVDGFRTDAARVETFTNGSATDTYTTKAGASVPSVQKFLADKSAEINVAAGGILAQSTAQAGIAATKASEASASATAAAASAASAANSDFVQNFKVTAGTGSGKNIIANPSYNDVPTDVNASVISGGGNSVNRNLIGWSAPFYYQFGTGAQNSWTTPFSVTSLSNVTVWLIRADGVLVVLTQPQKPSLGLTLNGSNQVVVSYPLPGHFVNDATGGNEGTNSFVLPSQRLIIQDGNKVQILGSSASYSGIYGGYDNVQMGGIMNHQLGAHHRIGAGTNHYTQLGGSYNYAEAGTAAYGVMLGGTMGYHGAGVGSGAASVGGYGVVITGAQGSSLGGNAPVVSGARAVNLGGNGNVTGGSDGVSYGNGTNNTGAGQLAGGLNVTSTGLYGIATGSTLTASGSYSAVFGRDNSNTKDYSLVTGRYAVGRTIGARTIAGGQRAAAGDSQSQDVAMRVTTTDATPTYLQLIDGSVFANLPDSSNSVVSVLIAATNTADQSGGAWRLDFRIKRVGTSTTTVLGSTLTAINVDAAASTWAISVVPSNSLSGWRIQVTGEAGKTINWSAVGRDVSAG